MRRFSCEPREMYDHKEVTILGLSVPRLESHPWFASTVNRSAGLWAALRTATNPGHRLVEINHCLFAINHFYRPACILASRMAWTTMDPPFFIKVLSFFEVLTPFWGALEIGATGSTFAILL